jgi:cellulose synthase/poly-beta-1,6-N-acetylglucosamine synthase-like glycosyltransferase
MLKQFLSLIPLLIGSEGASASAGLPAAVSSTATYVLGALAVVMLAYGLRHYFFTVHRLLYPQKRTFENIQVGEWPSLTVFIAAHNEEAVIAHCIGALVEADYPRDRLTIIPVNDRSKDRTKEICDEWAAKYPGLVVPFHRTEGKPGKPAALKDACELTNADVLIVFDADYIPGKGLLKQIVAPFYDPEVGVTMGRVVPCNVSTNLLTRMLDMERSAGYQGDQQARHNLSTIPQFGGTVGGIRASALRAVGGFKENILAEDTDLTYRLLEKGWKVSYCNTAECYEEVPENWPVRVKQLNRWAKGHNQVFLKFFFKSVFNKHLTFRERVESAFVLGCYSVAPLSLLGWMLVLLTYFADPAWSSPVVIPVLALVAYGGFGNSAAFFQMASAVRLDGNAGRLRLLPLNVLGYLVSAITISRGAWSLVVDTLFKREMKWDKTVRFRQQGSAPVGKGN